MKELDNMKDNHLSTIREILEEKREKDKSNMDLELKISGKGISE
jgi:hypothetical protein